VVVEEEEEEEEEDLAGAPAPGAQVHGVVLARTEGWEWILARTEDLEWIFLGRR
jgi:hypothetical protein